MIKHYTFDYNVFDAQACFKVDTDIFTDEHANATLKFFTWDYDEDADPIDEVMKKYAMTAIISATNNNYNLKGVIGYFNNLEGFVKVDGSIGIELNAISGYEFDEENLVTQVVID